MTTDFVSHPNPETQGIARFRPKLTQLGGFLARRTRQTGSKIFAAILFAVALYPVALLVFSTAPTALITSAVVTFFALAMFIALLWRGVSVIWAAPALALLLAFANPDVPPIPFFEQNFAAPAASIVFKFFPIFLASAIFGHVLAASGCATSLALGLSRGLARRFAPLVVAGVCGMLMMGGVGVFVIAFSVFPVARAIYQRERLPLHLAPAAIAFGAFTVTMTAIPGAPSLNNIIAAGHLGTTAFAAPGLGLTAGMVTGAFGAWWLVRVAASAPKSAQFDESGISVRPMPFSLAMAPLLTAIASGWLLTWLFTTQYSDVMGQLGPTYWAVMMALGLGTAVAAATGGSGILRSGLDQGAAAAIGPLVGTALGFGFGNALATAPAAEALRGVLEGTLGGSTLPAAAASTALFTGLVGSSSGGLALWFEAIGTNFSEVGSAEVLHRVVVLASGCIDTAPHGAAVIALLSICGTSHIRAYRDIFMVTVIGPCLGLAAAFAVLSMS